MITKISYSEAGTWKPSASEKEKKLAGSCEVSAFKLSSGAGSAVVVIYDALDSSEVIPANRKWYLDCSTTDNDINIFASPLAFRRGIYAVCEQGWDFQPVVCISTITP